jgi:hypothetical protein
MNDIYGWKYGQKWTNFILNVGNKHYFSKKLNKKNRVETIYVGFFKKQFEPWNTQITLQNHISYFLNMKYIQALQKNLHNTLEVTQ